jgi:hypothetical protein
MKRFAVTIALAVLLWPAVALSQGNEATTAGTPDDDAKQNRAVQAGAGSKGDVTTGSSGPSSGGSEKVTPLATTFEIRPASHPLFGPEPLALQEPRQLRCEVIGHAAARQRCEARATRLKGGSE